MQADDEFTWLIYGRHELVVIANWKRPCWKAQPMYKDNWSSTIYFEVGRHDHHGETWEQLGIDY